MRTKKEMVKAEANLPVAASDYEEHEGRGFQNQTSADVAIPFINLLQDMSPEVKRKNEKYIEGAEAGMFLNSVTGDLYESFVFVPAITERWFVEWKPRTEGGGLVGRHHPDSALVAKAVKASKEFGKYTTEEGNELAETVYMFGVLSNDNGDNLGTAMLALTSTKITPYKKFNGRLSSFQLNITDEDGNLVKRITPPMFAHTIRVTSKVRPSAKGDAFIPVFEAAVEDDLRKSLIGKSDARFQLAAQVEQLVDSGKAKYDESTQSDAVAEDEDDLPF